MARSFDRNSAWILIDCRSAVESKMRPRLSSSCENCSLVRLAVPRRIASAVTFASPANSAGSASAPPLNVTLNRNQRDVLPRHHIQNGAIRENLPRVWRQADLRGQHGDHVEGSKTNVDVGCFISPPPESASRLCVGSGPRYCLATRKTSAAVTASYRLGVSYTA